MKKKMACGGRPMTAIVLAGGRGRRMKADKTRLDVAGRTLLEHVLAQVELLFDEVLVSITPRQTLAPLACAGISRPSSQNVPQRSSADGAARTSSASPRVIEDEIPGSGPLGGLLAGLKAALNHACAVVACDIPDIDVPLLRSLARAAVDAEIAVPVGPSGLYEPLFAVYHKSVVPKIEALLAGGERSLLPLYRTCRTAVVRFDEPGRIRNLNTRADYDDYLRSLAGRKAGQPPVGNRRAKKSSPKERA